MCSAIDGGGLALAETRWMDRTILFGRSANVLFLIEKQEQLLSILSIPASSTVLLFDDIPMLKPITAQYEYEQGTKCTLLFGVIGGPFGPAALLMCPPGESRKALFFWAVMITIRDGNHDSPNSK